MQFGNFGILSELPGERAIWEKVAEVLSGLAALPLGRTEIIPRVMYVNKEEYVTREPGLVRPEEHHLFFDVQTVLQNMELVRCYAPEKLILDMPYDAARDIAFYKAGAEACQSGILECGHIAVIPPYEAHASQMMVFAGESLPIKKAVVKILASAVLPEWN